MWSHLWISLFKSLLGILLPVNDADRTALRSSPVDENTRCFNWSLNVSPYQNLLTYFVNFIKYLSHMKFQTQVPYLHLQDFDRCHKLCRGTLSLEGGWLVLLSRPDVLHTDSRQKNSWKNTLSDIFHTQCPLLVYLRQKNKFAIALS